MADADWREVLKLRMAAAGLNARNVALAAGLGPTAVRDILSGRSKRPRFQTLYKIGQVLGCTVEDLLNPPDDLADTVLGQDDGNSHGSASRGRRLTNNQSVARTGPSRRRSLRFIPIVALEAIEDGLPEEDWIVGEFALPQELIDRLQVVEPVALIVRDDAMAPTIRRGELLLVDRAVSRPRRDGVYVLSRPGQVTVRRLRLDPIRETLSILTDNPHYPEMAQVALSEVQVFGLVVWQGRPL